jgi:hypothetical protein
MSSCLHLSMQIAACADTLLQYRWSRLYQSDWRRSTQPPTYSSQSLQVDNIPSLLLLRHWRLLRRNRCFFERRSATRSHCDGAPGAAKSPYVICESRQMLYSPASLTDISNESTPNSHSPFYRQRRRLDFDFLHNQLFCVCGIKIFVWSGAERTGT